MMPPDELATLSPPHQESAAANPALRFIVLLGLLDAFGPLGIDMYLPAFPRIEHDLSAERCDAVDTVTVPGRPGDRSTHLRPDFRSGRPPCALALWFGGVRHRVLDVCVRPLDRGPDPGAFRHGPGRLDRHGDRRAVVRDSFEEADSSRIYSMLMLVIGIAPIISPSVGGWLMQVGGWGSIFWALAGFTCLCGVAVAIDLPETHPPDRRNRDSAATIFGRYARLIVDPRFMGYAAPVSLALGMIFAYVASAPSIFMQVYMLSPQAFTLIFAGNAIGLIGAAQVNRWLTRHLIPMPSSAGPRS